ncbi:MAG TPA: 7TM-DISM domain-containing protein, partial [Pedobacter sp.]
MNFPKLAIILTFFFCLNGVLKAQNSIYTKAALDQKYIKKDLYVFQDSTGKLSFSQVRNLTNSFKPTNSNVPNLGISRNNNWLKFKLTNNSDIQNFILNLSNPIIDNVSLYTVKGGKVDSTTYTNYNPLSDRNFKHQFYLFPISLSNGESIECYLKLRSGQQILAPITLISDKNIITTISDADTRAGLYLGIMLVMFMYNLFIYFTVRDKDYIVY